MPPFVKPVLSLSKEGPRVARGDFCRALCQSHVVRLRFRLRARDGRSLWVIGFSPSVARYVSGGAKIVTPKSGSLAVRSVCGAPAGIISRSPARISCSLPETRATAQPSRT
jgi:hypothetical protein